MACLQPLQRLMDLQTDANGDPAALGQMWAELQDLMWNNVGVLRTGEKLNEALMRIHTMRDTLAKLTPSHGREFNLTLQDWFDLRSGLLTAETITLSAINRPESRGAHQREDFVDTDKGLEKNQRLHLNSDGLLISDFIPLITDTSDSNAAEQLR